MDSNQDASEEAGDVPREENGSAPAPVPADQSPLLIKRGELSAEDLLFIRFAGC